MNTKDTKQAYEILAKALSLYAGNSGGAIEIPGGVNLLAAAVKCGVSGILAKLARDGEIINAGARFAGGIERAAGECYHSFLEAEKAAADFLYYAGRQSVRCVAGGDYALSADYLGAGDLHIAEVVFYVSGETEYPCCGMPVRQLLMPAEFFDRYYDSCIKLNKAPVAVMYCEERKHARAGVMDAHMARFYLLHCLYREIFNLKSFIPDYTCRSAVLEELFSAGADSVSA